MGLAFTCKATIVGVKQNSQWYYMTCSQCSIKHVYVEDEPWCNSCHKFLQEIKPKYKIELSVMESKEKVVFVVMGENAEKIMGNLSIKELMELRHIIVKR